MQKKDRRRTRRVRLTFQDPVPCQVYRPDDDEGLAGVVIDLSEAGAGIKVEESSRSWREGEEILLRVRLPGVLGPIRLSGEIRHYRSLGPVNGAFLGVQLIGTQSASHYALQVSRLKRFLSSRAPISAGELESRII